MYIVTSLLSEHYGLYGQVYANRALENRVSTKK